MRNKYLDKFIFTIALTLLACVVQMAITGCIQADSSFSRRSAYEMNADYSAPVVKISAIDSRGFGNRKGFAGAFPTISKGVVKILLDLAPGKPVKKLSVGTGILWDKDLHVVTAFHLFEEVPKAKRKTTFTVYLNGGKKVNARLIAEDRSADLALVKLIPPRGAKLDVLPARLGSGPVVGQSAYAVGFPRNDFSKGYNCTVTTGVVGAVDRRLTLAKGKKSEPYFQIDAYANSGSSGGGVFTEDGRLIGIVMRVLQNKAGVWDGATYAMDSKMVAVRVKQLLDALSNPSVKEITPAAKKKKRNDMVAQPNMVK